jgi:hypothetical protein
MHLVSQRGALRNDLCPPKDDLHIARHGPRNILMQVWSDANDSTAFANLAADPIRFHSGRFTALRPVRDCWKVDCASENERYYHAASFSTLTCEKLKSGPSPASFPLIIAMTSSDQRNALTI